MRKRGDSNPRYGNPVRQFSKLVVSATHPHFLTLRVQKYKTLSIEQIFSAFFPKQMPIFAAKFYHTYQMAPRTKIILSVCAVIIGICAIIGCQQAYRMFYRNIHSINGEKNYIYVYKNTTFEQLLSEIKTHNVIESESTFRFHARLLHFTTPKAGRYLINAQESDLQLIRKLRNGEQTPTSLTFNNIRTKEQLAGRLGSQLMLDSITILQHLNDKDFLKQYDLTPETAVCIFIPNTYEVFWNISVEQLFNRMQKEYKHFWNENRLALAKQAGLTPVEVCILASIVEEETNKSAEKPIIAGLYINRLRIGMPLQACPTIRFALNDFTLNRVLLKHIQTDSPYNTYKYKGLPPGPIRIPTGSTMDAVLNYTHHNYLYMCAKETFNGEHNFARTLTEHNRNAARYQRELNKRKIY